MNLRAHRIGGWVGPTASLDVMEMTKVTFISDGNRNQDRPAQKLCHYSDYVILAPVSFCTLLKSTHYNQCTSFCSVRPEFLNPNMALL
jgi:hypothetical protein